MHAAQVGCQENIISFRATLGSLQQRGRKEQEARALPKPAPIHPRNSPRKSAPIHPRPAPFLWETPHLFLTVCSTSLQD